MPLSEICGEDGIGFWDTAADAIVSKVVPLSD
jgi:hypothetical protein